MSKKGERNQRQQPSKAEKAYGGYLPSVEDPADPDRAGAAAENAPGPSEGRTMHTPAKSGM